MMISACLLVLSLFTAQEGVEGRSPHRELSLESADPEVAKLLAAYRISDRDFPWKMRLRHEKESVRVYEVSFPSPVTTEVEELNTVWCKYWVPVGDDGRHPAAVMLHWLGGSFDMLEVVCEHLARRGLATLMVWLPGYGKRRPKDPEKRLRFITLDNGLALARFRQAILDVHRAGDWLAARPEIDSKRVGLVGISLGAVVGALACGVDTHLQRACFIVGGGDLPDVVFHGSKETIEIKQRAGELGITREKLGEIWREIEPCVFACRIRPYDVLMINSEHDQVFPRSSTEQLWEAMGRPEIVWINADHYTWALQIGKILDQIEHHFMGSTPPRIRVLLKESAEHVTLEIKGAYDVRRPGPVEPVARGMDLGRVTVSAREGGVQVGDRPWREPWLIVEPREPFKVGDRTYVGSVHFIAARSGGVHVVNEVDLERYVVGVVGPEIGASAPAEALKAQAVCARTYAYQSWCEVARSAQRQIFDVYDDVRDQVYRGVPEEGGSVEQAVKATCGRVLFWKGAPLRAYFSSTCGGATESGAEVFANEAVPLAGTTCGQCGEAKWYSWTLRMSPAELSGALRGVVGGEVREVAVSSLTRTGRVARVAVKRTDGIDVLIGAPEFRKSIGYEKLRSTKFNVVRDGGSFVFSGNGWGHAVGLCQEGAIGMAKGGASWEAIVSKYYPSAELAELK